MISILTRLSLIGLIIYGGYLLFVEQRIVRLCEDEVKSIEKSFEAKLDPRSTVLEFRCLNTDPLFFSWLYHAPANRSFAIQILSKDTNGTSTTTLLRIPEQSKSHYGIIDLQFNTKDISPPLIKQLEVFGPNFLKAELSAGDDSQFKSPKFLGLVISDKNDAFAIFQERQRRSTPYYYLANQQQSTTHPCHAGAPVALCYFTEEETAGMPLKLVEHIIRATIDD